ncbi:MAG: 1,4-dihydroxy-2-naphthoate octaprenyltransferase [Candidatus Marinimicrobia bacterium]|nr:1,4-dihydroxy-2-naphthoate octaprenyltransferase [Candidatus Neomarinimicrobiota bacterium]
MKEKTNNQDTPSGIKKWWVAIRPFALPASVMPVFFGSVLAVTVGDASLNWLLFVSAMVAMAILHTGSNLLNDVYDFKKGIDQHVNPVSGAVVRGWITAREARFAGILCLFCGSLLGLLIAAQVGYVILFIGIVGVTIGIIYTWGPLPLKFNALGDLAVFLNFGILGSLGAWTVQTGSPSWTPVIWAIPMSLLVVGILHSNNWRDINTDVGSGIRTIASVLGDRLSEGYYSFLIMGPFVVIITLILITRLTGFTQQMPYTFLITFLAIPAAFKLTKKGKHRFISDQPMNFMALDGATAQLNLLFGVLCVIALGIDKLI